MTHYRPMIAGLAAVLFVSLAPPHAAEAQEIRLTGGYAAAANSDLIGGYGWGMGIRYFHWAALGFGIESDRFSRTFELFDATCRDDGLGCLEEQVSYDTDLSTTTFVVLLGLAPHESVEIRVGGGRSAGALTSHGVGQTSGRDFVVPPSDRDAGILAWSRGADGHVLYFEGIFALPGPFSAYGAYRRHNLQMEGCGEGRNTFLCGPLNHWDLNVGLHFHLIPRRGEG